MTTAQFDITIDRSRNLLNVRMGSFFSVDDVGHYHAAVDAATLELGGDPGRQRMLSDITAMRIQPQEVVNAFRAFMAEPRYAERKVAFIVDKTLARMQIDRAKADRRARCFHTRRDAETWLFAEDRAAA